MGLWSLILHFDQNLNSLVMTHAGLAYAVIFTIVFLEIGVLPFFFLPSNPFLFVCGTLCAAGDLSLAVTLPLLLLASWLGSLCGYAIGSTVGYSFFVEYLHWPKPAQFQKTHDFYAKHGTLGLMFSNYLPVIRTLAPFVAGLTRMRFTAFLQSSAIGSVLWIFGCVMAGYFFGNIPIVKQHLGLFTLAGLTLVILAFLAGQFVKMLKKR
jgi:membrane-associated protein